MASTLEDAIQENALTPASISTREGSVGSQPLSEQIRADQYLRGREAARASVPGIRLFQVVPTLPQ